MSLSPQNINSKPSQWNPSIAVLPFVNRSTDADNEYFSDGISEEIINALTTIEGLKVIARTSSFAFKGRNIDVRKIGQQLGVSSILEGSVRKAGQRLRITAQLIRTDDGSHLWSENFDRELEDIFALQDEISLLIADQVRENFGHLDIQDHLVKAPTQNIAAYQLYLKGRFHQLRWNAEDMALGVKYYQQSIALDPSYALPYFGAGLSCGIMASWGFIPYEEGVQQADHYLQKGILLKDKSDLAYFAQATVSFWGRWQFRLGYEFLVQAIKLNPAFTDAEEGLAELYTAIGDFEKAMQHTRNILLRNPLSPNHYYTLGNIHYLSGDYVRAIESFRGALKIDPEFSLALELIALCYIHLGEEEQLEQFLGEQAQLEQPAYCRILYRLVHGQQVSAKELEKLQSIKQEARPFSLIAWPLYLQVHMGNHDLALDLLEKGIERRIGQYINFRNDPFLRPLWERSRFQQFVQQIFDPSLLPPTQSTGAEKSTPPKSIFSPRELQHYLQELEQLMEEQELFLDPNLNLKRLAQALSLHPNKLSWLINEHLGHNFNEYINHYRLRTFKRKALLNANQHLTLLALAYESGFNSKTVFNTFFKKTEGTTPRNWLKNQ